MRSLPSLVFVCLALAACRGSQSPPPRETAAPKVASVQPLPERITLDVGADRSAAGLIYIDGKTNLPDGIKLGVEIRLGRRLVAQDNSVFVRDAAFRTEGLNWAGRTIPPGRYKVTVLSYFTPVWQTPEILNLIGRGGLKLRGGPIVRENPDVHDSGNMLVHSVMLPLPAMSRESEAIALVRTAVLEVEGKGRSGERVDRAIEILKSTPDVRERHGWSAEHESGSVYRVSYDFIGGASGPQQAVWTADLATRKVRIANDHAKLLSYAPPR